MKHRPVFRCGAVFQPAAVVGLLQADRICSMMQACVHAYLSGGSAYTQKRKTRTSITIYTYEELLPAAQFRVFLQCYFLPVFHRVFKTVVCACWWQGWAHFRARFCTRWLRGSCFLRAHFILWKLHGCGVAASQQLLLNAQRPAS